MTKKPCSDIPARVAAVRARMENAAAMAGHRAADITLVGVTKTQPAEAVRELLLCGVTDIGENRVQELLAKAPLLADLPHRAHMIGHLQKNKAKLLPGCISMLQSLDSADTAAALEKALVAAGCQLEVLIEVNIGGELSKSGVPAAGLPALAERVLASDVLRLRGLMTIPPLCEGEKVRRYFEQMHALFVDIQAKNRDNTSINILSMGMSADFEYAIREGATMVRVGSDLFGPRR